MLGSPAKLESHAARFQSRVWLAPVTAKLECLKPTVGRQRPESVRKERRRRHSAKETTEQRSVAKYCFHQESNPPSRAPRATEPDREVSGRAPARPSVERELAEDGWHRHQRGRSRPHFPGPHSPAAPRRTRWLAWRSPPDQAATSSLPTSSRLSARLNPAPGPA